MATNPANQYCFGHKLNHYNQPKIVATDIKHIMLISNIIS